MNKLKMTRILLAVLAFVGFSAAQAVSVDDLHNSEVFKNHHAADHVSIDDRMSKGLTAHELYQIEQEIKADGSADFGRNDGDIDHESMKQWKDYIKENPNVDLKAITDNFKGFTMAERLTLASYQQEQTEDEGSEDDWEEDDWEEDDSNDNSAVMNQWKKYIDAHPDVYLMKVRGFTQFSDSEQRELLAYQQEVLNDKSIGVQLSHDLGMQKRDLLDAARQEGVEFTKEFTKEVMDTFMREAKIKAHNFLHWMKTKNAQIALDPTQQQLALKPPVAPAHSDAGSKELPPVAPVHSGTGSKALPSAPTPLAITDGSEHGHHMSHAHHDHHATSADQVAVTPKQQKEFKILKERVELIPGYPYQEDSYYEKLPQTGEYSQAAIREESKKKNSIQEVD